MLNEIRGTDKMKRFVGVDTSTNGFAYALIDNGKLTDYDEIRFNGDLSERLGHAKAAAKFICNLEPDFALVEQAIFLNNKAVVVKLAYFAGTMLSELAYNEIPFTDVAPITWQSGIGNPYYTKAEKDQIRKRNKGKSASQIRNEVNRLRKERTMAIIKERFGVEVDGNDNISDAIGIAIYAMES